MRKISAVIVLLLAIWIVINHDRIYFHDFLAKIEVAGKADTQNSVYVNTADDVLMISNTSPRRLQLVRPSGAAPVLPGSINCIYGLACLVHKEDSAALASIPVMPDASVNKNSRAVSFRTADGLPAIVRLH